MIWDVENGPELQAKLDGMDAREVSPVDAIARREEAA